MLQCNITGAGNIWVSANTNSSRLQVRSDKARAARIGSVRWPIRHRLFGGIEGRQACAAGIGFSPSPGGKRSAQARKQGRPKASGIKA